MSLQPPTKKRKRSTEFLESKFKQDSSEDSASEDSAFESDDDVAIDYQTLYSFIKKQVLSEQALKTVPLKEDKKDFSPPNKN